MAILHQFRLVTQLCKVELYSLDSVFRINAADREEQPWLPPIIALEYHIRIAIRANMRVKLHFIWIVRVDQITRHQIASIKIAIYLHTILKYEYISARKHTRQITLAKERALHHRHVIIHLVLRCVFRQFHIHLLYLLLFFNFPFNFIFQGQKHASIVVL